MARLSAWVSYVVRLAIKTAAIAAVAVGLCYGAHRAAQIMGACSEGGSGTTPQTAAGTGDLPNATEPGGEPLDEYPVLYNRKLDEFVAPETNQVVKLDLRAGGAMQGRLVEIASNSVLLEQGGMVVGCMREALAPATRIRFFREDYARHYANLGTATNGAAQTAEASAGKGAPAATSVRIICPCCSGEGYYMMRRRPPAPDVREVCPICHTRGFAVVELRPGMVLCPDCKGWGKTWYTDAKIATAVSQAPPRVSHGASDDIAMRMFRECRRCSQSGFVRAVGAQPGALAGVPSSAPSVAPPAVAKESIWLPVVRILDGFWHQIDGWYSSRGQGRNAG